MSVVESDSGLLSARERQLALASERLKRQQEELAAETKRLEAELAAARAARQAAASRPVATPAIPLPPGNPVSPATTATGEPAPPPVAAPAEGEEPPADTSTHWQIAAVPSWLVSLVIHLLFFIALGLLTLPELLDTAPTTLTAALAEEIAIDTLQEIAIAPPLENSQEHEFQAPAGEMSDLANMTDEAAVGDGSGSYIAADVDAVEIGELDEAFGGRGQGLKTVGGMGGGAEFFGVKAGGKRFVFVVDSSNSMRGEKFEDAKEELVYAIRRLDKKQMFYVIFFDQDALRMFTAEGTNGEPEPRPVFATTQNINKLEKWLKDVDLEGRTNPYDAMKFAVELLPDAIYLLSDGQFTDRGRTEDYLRANNILDDPAEGYRPKVVIHTIGFYSKEGEVTLQAIAKAYQGTYRFVAPKPARARRR